MTQRNLRRYASTLGIALLTATCGSGEPADRDRGDTARSAVWELLFTVEGLDGPEAVRYDPARDVYFVSNFAGDPGERAANGFVSRVGAEGEVQTLRFMVGTDAHPLHAPRGMFLDGDTLWVADIDGVHGFDPETGTHRTFVPVRQPPPGFLNDVAASPDGAVYVTDTGGRVYAVRPGPPAVAVEGEPIGRPNGITWLPDRRAFVLAPWNGPRDMIVWTPGAPDLDTLAIAEGGFFDGVEVLGTALVVASQADSSLHALEDGQWRRIVRLRGAPADIGVDTRRGRIAVPFVARDQVDVYGPGRG